MLSILIPTYEYDCSELVCCLHQQCEEVVKTKAFDYEIIVADDRSQSYIWQNVQATIQELSHCSFIRMDENIGRSRIRNLLAKHAQGDRLLFIDCHMDIIADDYIQRYLDTDADADICQGGYVVERNDSMKENLRYIYEYRARHLNKKQPNGSNGNRDFHTSNFLVKRQLFLDHPLDETINRYGYEDVLYGKQLNEIGIHITEIDNPVGFSHFESNEAFVKKTEDSIETLHFIGERMGDYSRLRSIAQRIKRWHFAPILCCIFSLTKEKMRENLCGSHPNLHVFDLYKLLYLLNLDCNE